MKKILALALFAVALVSCRQTMQTDGFKLGTVVKRIKLYNELIANVI